MSLINQDRLSGYLEDKYNVLFKGKHGVGKTAVIKAVFDQAFGEDGWLYFSAPTLDPWVDFVGVPKVIDLANGEQVLRLIRPEVFATRKIKAIFFDEFNRAAPKVVNAVMELIQFKTINGHPHPDLEVVWAAINPRDDEDTYNVNYLDPAQEDRFQVHLDVPFKVDTDFFLNKYPDNGQIFIDWWDAIPKDLRELVSPRRLDYAADAFEKGHRLEDFLDARTNVKALRDMLKQQPFLAQVRAVTTESGALAFMKNGNNATRLLDLVKNGNAVAIAFIVKYIGGIPKELLDPFIVYLDARKSGLTVVENLPELATLVAGKKKKEDVVDQINTCDFRRLWPSVANLVNDVLALEKQNQKLLRDLAAKLNEFIIGTVKVEKLERGMWGSQGMIAGQPSNFQVLLCAVAKARTALSASERRAINLKLSNNGISTNHNLIDETV